MSDTDWSRFRVETISRKTYWKRNLIHVDLLHAVLTRRRGGVLEAGVGSGAQSALLSHLVRTTTVDNSLRIIHEARPNLDRFGRNVEIVAADAFHLPFPDQSFGVGISQGLLEHFDPVDAGRLLAEQLRVCRSVAFSVPSDRYPRQDVGDERLLPPARWKEILEVELGPLFEIRARYYRIDPERVKYSARAGRDLGGFHVLVTIDRG